MLTEHILFVALVVWYNMLSFFEERNLVPRRTPKKVLRAEDEQLRDYELVVIINPEVVEEKFDATIDSVSQFVTEKGGTISNVERWGKKRLAYPIEHFMEGSYVLTHFSLKPALSKELEVNLKISEEVLRHLLVRLSS
jgi:small subunit ribosomal protein S6